MFEKKMKVSFPKAQGICVNMMPIIIDDQSTWPDFIFPYEKIIKSCNLDGLGYISIHESIVGEGDHQRRPGIHTEANARTGWGGGWGGIKKDKGIWMASNDGACRIWRKLDWSGDHMGAVSKPDVIGETMDPNTLYWMTDRTPHETLPAITTHMRQWFRLVSDQVSLWFSQHSTPNPLGVKPNCLIVEENKFQRATVKMKRSKNVH